MTAPVKVDPSTPHAFGCHTCVQAGRARIAAENVASRLFALLVTAEAREARQRDEIGALEQRLTRHTPKWEPETTEPTGPVGSNNPSHQS